MIVSQKEFLRSLQERITPEERTALAAGEGLPISAYNRATMLRLLSDEGGEATADTDRAGALERSLQAYLDRYMADLPGGHKWVILSCLYLALAVGEPMHPQPVTGWIRRGEAYFCPAREDQEGSLCRWCACRPMET